MQSALKIGDQVGSLDPEDNSDDRGIVEAVSPDGTCAKVKWNNGNTHWAQVSILSPCDEADDLDFAMLAPPTRPGPCKAAATPETDSTAKRLERLVEAAENIAAAAEAKAIERGALPCNALSLRNQVRKLEISKALAADVCCLDCGHETGYPGRCMSCDWAAARMAGFELDGGQGEGA